MNPTELTYPVFEANQVLTNEHLNDVFEYLDEQTRLTRANLIGIGIPCGLDVTLVDPGTIRLTRGCGVTSQGYLIVQPDDVDLVAVRPYALPADLGYQPFVEPGSNPPVQYDLWELFADDDEPGAQALATSGLVLDDKAVLLFLELRKDGLRNCSPNNCDDRGAEITATVRRLLVDVADLDEITAAADALSPTHLGADLSERLALPDLRMPRFDVPNTHPVAPEEVLAAFQRTFSQGQLVAKTADALSKLYQAFHPLVVDAHPADPFAGLANQNRFGFLDTTPVTTAQVRFLQYYWDLFDDLLAAYDELRWAGVDLLCACCPPEGLFPRHLMAGVLDPDQFDPADYRHRFLPSPAVGDCEARTREVKLLFDRVVTMLDRFTDAPPHTEIRATPSRHGAVALSQKAIPYYFDQDGPRPLYLSWDPAKTARRRPHHNLSYRAGEYAQVPPDFVTDPLRYDLEPNDFLRIEGHLGKHVGDVLESLLSLREAHRLPIDVIALRTGAFDENVEVDLSREQCRFEDLEAIYEALKSDLDCFLVRSVRYFYDLPLAATDDTASINPTLGLLANLAPEYRAHHGTVGESIEEILSSPRTPRIRTIPGPTDIAEVAHLLVLAISSFAAKLPDDFRQLDLDALRTSNEQVKAQATVFERARRQGVEAGWDGFDAPGLADRLDDILFKCRLDPFDALLEQYRRRVREVKQAQYLSHFVERHPGIQHKAGVPIGGTFILVYHEFPKPAPPEPASPPPGPDDAGEGGGGGRVIERDPGDWRTRRPVELVPDLWVKLIGVEKFKEVGASVSKLQYRTELADDPDIKTIFEGLTGRTFVARALVSALGQGVYGDTIAGLEDGTVIADFFVPYRVDCGCGGITYTLPPSKLKVDVRAGCTRDGNAEVTLAVEGAVGSPSVRVDDGAFQPLSGPLLLAVGDHSLVVRDGSGNESPTIDLTVAPELAITNAEMELDEQTYQVTFTIVGGVGPYTADVGTVVDDLYTSPVLKVSEILTVTITDAAKCTVSDSFESGVEPCEFPCDGAATRFGHRFWLPEARSGAPINDHVPTVARFAVVDPDGNEIDLTERVQGIVESPRSISAADFESVVRRWLDRINSIVADALGGPGRFELEYEPATGDATTGSVFVDRIVCVDFTFHLAVEFTQARRERQLELIYTANGTVAVDRLTDAKVRIPPFDGSESNRCLPDEPPVPRCEEPDLALEIHRDGVAPDQVVLVAEVASGEAAAFLWEIQDGIPSLSGGDAVAVTFEPVEPVEKVIRLTGFTERGCSTTVERTINIRERDG